MGDLDAQSKILSRILDCCSILTGNSDERVSDRVLYDIYIQAGRIVDLHIPRDRETDKPRGCAFTKYESEQIAEYVVKLFSGLVTLYNWTLRFTARPPNLVCCLFLSRCPFEENWVTWMVDLLTLD